MIENSIYFSLKTKQFYKIVIFFKNFMTTSIGDESIASLFWNSGPGITYDLYKLQVILARPFSGPKPNKHAYRTVSKPCRWKAALNHHPVNFIWLYCDRAVVDKVTLTVIDLQSYRPTRNQTEQSNEKRESCFAKSKSSQLHRFVGDFNAAFPKRVPCRASYKSDSRIISAPPSSPLIR